MKIFKTILLLALVFCAGAVVGIVGTRMVVRRAMLGAFLHPERAQAVIERTLTRRLRLDNEQQVKLHQVLTDAHGQLQDLRKQYHPQLVMIFSNANDQINVMLTPEQQARFEKLKSENRPLLQAIQQAR